MSILRTLFGIDADGTQRPLRVDTAGRLKQSQAQPPFAESVLGAVADACTVDMDGFSAVTFSVAGTYSGTLSFEQTIDGVTWFPMLLAPSSSVGAGTTSTTATNTVWVGQAPGAVACRVRMSARTSGSATVRGCASSAAITPIPATHAVSGTVNTTPTSPTSTTLESAASTNATLITASAVSLFEVTAFNPTAAAVYVKFFNKTTAPVPGTDTPFMTIPVPAGQLVAVNFGSQGKRYTGMGFAITAGAAKTDTAVVGAGVQLSYSRL